MLMSTGDDASANTAVDNDVDGDDCAEESDHNEEEEEE